MHIILCFSFPKEPNIKEKWMDLTGRDNWFPTKTSTICSKHFQENDFVIKKSGNRYLRADAIPSDNVVRIVKTVSYDRNLCLSFKLFGLLIYGIICL